MKAAAIVRYWAWFAAAALAATLAVPTAGQNLAADKQTPTLKAPPPSNVPATPAASKAAPPANVPARQAAPKQKTPEKAGAAAKGKSATAGSKAPGVPPAAPETDGDAANVDDGGTTNVGPADDVNFIPSEPDPEQPGGGFLGRSMAVDAGALLLAALLGGLIGAVLIGRSRASIKDLVSLWVDVKKLKEGVRASAQLSSSPTPSAAQQQQRYAPVDTRKSAFQLEREVAADRVIPRETAAESAVAAARAAEREQSARISQAVDKYRKLVTSRSAKPRQFSELLSAFSEVHGLVFDGARFTAVPYREDDVNQFVVAVGDGERFAVLPTHEYVSNFSIAFSMQVQNPEIVRQLFNFSADGSGQIQFEQPAQMLVDGTGALQLDRKGRLGGLRG